MKSPPQTKAEEQKISIFKAFLVGAAVHALLLALSLSDMSGITIYIMFVFAFPGLVVDISSEMIHPSKTGGYFMAILATIVNGAAYAGGFWLLLIVKSKLRK